MRKSLLAATVFLMSACGGVSVTSDWDSSIDFASMRSYAWQPGAAIPDGVDQISDGRIKGAVESSLNAKGLRKVDASQADLILGYQVTTEDETTYTTMNTGWGGGYGMGGVRYGGGMAMGTSTTTANTYTNGTLIIGMFQPSDKALVWHGSGTAKLQESQTPEERTQRINQAVEKIMETFPPS